MAFILASGSDSEMADAEDGDHESKKETPKEAENDFDDADFDFNVADDDDIQEIIHHRERCKTI